MIVIEVNKKGAKVQGIEKCVEKALKKQYSGIIDVKVYRKEIPESRSERFSDAQSLVADAKSQAEDLRDELQNWLDNLPENLSQSSKADELQSAIDELETFINSCDECEGIDVSFPSMF